MKNKKNHKRFSSTMRVASFVAKNEFPSALEEINTYLYNSNLCSKKRSSYLIDLFSQPAITELLTNYIANKADQKSHMFCEYLLACSFTNITIQKWRNVFFGFLQTLSTEDLESTSLIISKLHNERCLIPSTQILPICYVLTHQNHNAIFPQLSKHISIDTQLADKFLEITSPKKNMCPSRRAKNNMILAHVMLNDSNFSTFCSRLNERLSHTLLHLDILKTDGDVIESLEYIAQTRRMLHFLPAKEKMAILRYLKNNYKEASQTIVSLEILHFQNIIENNKAITDFQSLAFALDHSYINENTKRDIARLLVVIYQMIDKTSLEAECNAWQKFTLCTFSITCSFPSKAIWLYNARHYPEKTMDIFLRMYTKWPSLMQSTASLLLLMNDSIKQLQVDIKDAESFTKKLSKHFKAAIRNNTHNHRYILNERLFNISITPEATLPHYFPFMSYNLHCLFSNGYLRKSFMVCKGGLIRSFIDQYIPNDVIIKIFSELNLFSKTTLIYEQISAFFIGIANIDCIMPNTQEFHISILTYLNDNAHINQDQRYKGLEYI